MNRSESTLSALKTYLPSVPTMAQRSGGNPRFYGLESEDAYFFFREFEEVCLMMRIPQLGEDAIRLRFISFALKDLAKKWLYSLVVDSISTWDNFVKMLLKKLQLIHKTTLIRKNIMHCKQEHNEPF